MASQSRAIAESQASRPRASTHGTFSDSGTVKRRPGSRPTDVEGTLDTLDIRAELLLSLPALFRHSAHIIPSRQYCAFWPRPSYNADAMNLIKLSLRNCTVR